MSSPAEVAYEQANISDNRQPGLIISTSIMLAVGILAVAARFIARRIVHMPYRLDDWSILFALVCFIGWCTGHILLTRYGYGRHTILSPNLVSLGKAVLATETLYNPVIIGIKLSILFLYHRLFPSRRLKNIMWVVGAVVVAYSVTQLFAVIFQCSPIDGSWNSSVKSTCINIGAVILVMSIMNIVTDVVILILPMPIIWRLHMSRNRKLQVSGVFLMGICVVVISIVRANYVLQTGQRDPAWLDVPGSEITGIELGVAMLTACLPVYLPIIRYARNGSSSLGQTGTHVESKEGFAHLKGGTHKSSPTHSGSTKRFPSSERTYTSSANRMQTEVEGQELTAEEFLALDSRYGMNGRILVTKSVEAESQTRV